MEKIKSLESYSDLQPVRERKTFGIYHLNKTTIKATKKGITIFTDKDSEKFYKKDDETIKLLERMFKIKHIGKEEIRMVD